MPIPIHYKPVLIGAAALLTWHLFRKDRRQRVPFTGRKHAVLVPEVIERAAGKFFFARLCECRRRLPDSDPRTQHVQAIGAAIVRAAHAGDGAGGYVGHLKDWWFVVLADPTVNACALPGGTVCVNSGLIDKFAGYDACLAFVIGHEVGHVVARHFAEQVTLEAAPRLVALIVQGIAILILLAAGYMPTKRGARLAEEWLDRGLSWPRIRELEYEADAIGVELVRRARLGDRTTAIAFFHRADALDAAERAATARQWAYLPTHPSGSDRARALLQGRLVAKRPKAGAWWRGGARAMRCGRL